MSQSRDPNDVTPSGTAARLVKLREVRSSIYDDGIQHTHRDMLDVPASERILVRRHLQGTC